MINAATAQIISRSAELSVKFFFGFYWEEMMNIKRREFLGFFLIGSLVSLVMKKLGRKGSDQPKEAMFWRKKA